MFKVGMLRRMIERYSNPTIPRRFGTTVAEWRVLTHLYSSSPMTATALSARLCADKAEVSRACNSLIRKGHVTRQLDASDARSMHLAISRSGVALHDRILPLRRALEDELKGILGAAQTEQLHRTLDELIRHFAAKLETATVPPPAAKALTRARRRQSPQ